MYDEHVKVSTKDKAEVVEIVFGSEFEKMAESYGITTLELLNWVEKGIDPREIRRQKELDAIAEEKKATRDYRVERIRKSQEAADRMYRIPRRSKNGRIINILVARHNGDRIITHKEMEANRAKLRGVSSFNDSWLQALAQKHKNPAVKFNHKEATRRYKRIIEDIDYVIAYIDAYERAEKEEVLKKTVAYNLNRIWHEDTPLYQKPIDILNYFADKAVAWLNR